MRQIAPDPEPLQTETPERHIIAVGACQILVPGQPDEPPLMASFHIDCGEAVQVRAEVYERIREALQGGCVIPAPGVPRLTSWMTDAA